MHCAHDLSSTPCLILPGRHGASVVFVAGPSAADNNRGDQQIGAQQYMAFAAQNPDLAMAAAAAVMSNSAGRPRAKWQVPEDEAPANR